MAKLPTTCRPGSAWHTWQLAGLDWRIQNPGAEIDAAYMAAVEFATSTGYPGLGQFALLRAFMEGARAAHPNT